MFTLIAEMVIMLTNTIVFMIKDKMDYAICFLICFMVFLAAAIILAEIKREIRKLKEIETK